METNFAHPVVTVEKLVYGGDGLARFEGRVALIRGVIPGERVEISLIEDKPQRLKAEPVAIIEPSPDRRTPPCPYFGRCGGCHYQHIADAAQPAHKRAILEETIARIGKLDPGPIQVRSGPAFGYRNRAQFHLQGRRIGYTARGSSRFQPVESCAICSPKLQQALTALAGMLQDRRFPTFLQKVELFTNETDVQLHVLESQRPVARHFFEWCAERIPGFRAGPISCQAAGFTFRVSRGVFFQVNRFLVDTLVEVALEGAQGERAIDLYAGAGLFSLPLATRFSRVTAVESSAPAFRDLAFNAAQAGLSLEAVHSTAESFLQENRPAADFLIADPPRAGLGKTVTQLLLEIKPAELVVVSCDPATLARDLGALSTTYRLDGLVLVDLFPQTYHLEAVARLKRK